MIIIRYTDIQLYGFIYFIANIDMYFIVWCCSGMWRVLWRRLTFHSVSSACPYEQDMLPGISHCFSASGEVTVYVSSHAFVSVLHFTHQSTNMHFLGGGKSLWIVGLKCLALGQVVCPLIPMTEHNGNPLCSVTLSMDNPGNWHLCPI